jgi:hypothetical protein
MPITPSYTNLAGSNDGTIKLYTWNLTTATPDGAPMEQTEWADRTWQATGSFGGATLAIQGSNDGVNWFPMTNAAGGTAIGLTAAGGAATVELPRFTRPNLTTVGVGATVAVTVCARRATPLRA